MGDYSFLIKPVFFTSSSGVTKEVQYIDFIHFGGTPSSHLGWELSHIHTLA